MYSNNIVSFHESTKILNAHTKKIWKLIVCTSYVYIYRYKNLKQNLSIIVSSNASAYSQLLACHGKAFGESGLQTIFRHRCHSKSYKEFEHI